MALADGARLGPYEIVSALGAGGMGEVYRARDTRLNRIVAIKVIVGREAANSAMRERFEREARAIALLSHANICTLHDIGHHEGTDFLVMEYSGGRDAGRAAQERCVAARPGADDGDRDGVGARRGASRRHRASRSEAGQRHAHEGWRQAARLRVGQASGLALAGAGVSMLSTTAPALTAQGTILGTLQYMAPEQLEGRDADARTDIFAFGAIVYEMATGRKAFEGKSQASLIAAILKHDPTPMSAIQPLTSPLLGHVVKTCLAKDRNERWQSAGDMTRALTWIARDQAIGDSSQASVHDAVAGDWCGSCQERWRASS